MSDTSKAMLTSLSRKEHPTGKKSRPVSSVKNADLAEVKLTVAPKSLERK